MRIALLLLAVMTFLAVPSAMGADSIVSHVEARECQVEAAVTPLVPTCELHLQHKVVLRSCTADACLASHSCILTLDGEGASADTLCGTVATRLAVDPLRGIDIENPQAGTVVLARGSCADFTVSGAGYGPSVARAKLGATGEFSHTLTVCA